MKCPICSNDVPHDYNFCGVDGYEFSDKKVLEEDKLFIESRKNQEAAKQKASNLTENQNIINDYKANLAKEKGENDKLRSDISEKDSKLTEASKQLKKAKIWVIVLGSLIFLISVVLGFTYKNLQSKLNSERRSNSSLIIEKQNLSERINSLQEEKGKIEEEKQSLQQKLNDISTVYPLIIKSIKVGNTYSNGEVETPFGDMLYSKNSMYLEPQVEYIGLKQDTTIRLYTKLYRGKELRIGRNSPSGGYTSCRPVTLSESGKAQLGRIGGNRGYWSRGNYRYEIWYVGMCLKTVYFTLY